MDHMTHQNHESVDQHAGHKMSDAHASHDRHAGHSVAMFRDKFWLSFALTIPVVIWSTDVQHWFGYRAPSFPGSNLIPQSSEQWSSFTAVSSSSLGRGASGPGTSPPCRPST